MNVSATRDDPISRLLVEQAMARLTEANAVALGRADRLRLADIIVIGAPMHGLNPSVLTTLRTWFHRLPDTGDSFSYSEVGPGGLRETAESGISQCKPTSSQ
jgi:FMN-dependent NADH-azoreductase